MPRDLRTALARTAAGVVALGSIAALVTGVAAGSASGAPDRARAVPVAVAPVAATVPATSAVSASSVATTKAGKVRAYGDSVMLGAAYALRHRLHAKVNADESRQSGTLLALVRKADKRGKLTGPVVIHTGTNGTIVRSVLESTLRPLRNHRVVLVTVKANRSWAAGNNKILRAVDGEFGNVVLADWQKKASKHSAWTYSDGIHLTPTGRVAYAKLIGKALNR